MHMMVLLLALLQTNVKCCDTSAAARQTVRDGTIKNLQSKGYEVVHSGIFHCIEETGGSGAGNPESNSCYVDLDISESGAIQTRNGVSGSATHMKTATNSLHTFQLEETDVLLYLGCAPESPGPLYYGWTPYLWGFTMEEAQIGRPAGQMVDSLNHLSMKNTNATNNGPLGQDNLPWGFTQAIISTADIQSASDTAGALSAAFSNSSNQQQTWNNIPVNVIPIPSALLNLGNGPSSNYFVMGARAGPFASTAARHAHAISATEPVVVLSRKRTQLNIANRSEKSPDQPVVATIPQPFPTPTRRNKSASTAPPELSLNSTMETILQGVADWGSERGYEVERRVTLTVQLRDGVPSNGTECVTNRSTAGCYADTGSPVRTCCDLPLFCLCLGNAWSLGGWL
jgi:hypothetical protein